MAKYCDTNYIEQTWFQWAIANETPQLNPFREAGCLYSRIDPMQIITHGEEAVKNPWLPVKQHIVAAEKPQLITSVEGVLNYETGDLSLGFISKNKENDIISSGFHKCLSEKILWDRLCTEINKMCENISKKFSGTDDFKAEISAEAFMMMAEKIKGLKIKYYPGKAPVFNFLTTAVHRCIYFKLKQDKRFVEKISDLKDKIINKSVDVKMRTYRVSGG